ncbi:MAG TPA: hypothetical protein DEA44_16790 [Firmicutes bacterium]|nr:hypothetical protein [Bacillota bacterium]
MKQVTRYKCEYCRTFRATILGIEKHEKECVHNPDSVNCYRCAYAYEGETWDDYGHRHDNVPMCAYTEDILRENGASECGRYTRTDKMYYQRRECPDVPEMEAPDER